MRKNTRLPTVVNSVGYDESEPGLMSATREVPAGVPSLRNLRGKPDLHGRPLQFTETGFADEVAAAASLLMGQADEGHPVVLVSGFAPTNAPLVARALLRPTSEDLFR